MGLASPPRHVDGAIGSNCRAGECEGIRQTREPPPHPDSGNQSGSDLQHLDIRSQGDYD